MPSGHGDRDRRGSRHHRNGGRRYWGRRWRYDEPYFIQPTYYVVESPQVTPQVAVQPVSQSNNMMMYILIALVIVGMFVLVRKY